MARFFKGVPVGSYLHGVNVHATGIPPTNPGGKYDVDTIVRHIVLGATTSSPCVSLTKSYGVAEMYALGSGIAFPTPSNPAYVYEIAVNPGDPDVAPSGLVDPVCEISQSQSDPSVSSYHHNGDRTFLLSIVDPRRFYRYGSKPSPQPKIAANASIPHISSFELRALVYALRDAEILVHGTIPARCIVYRHLVY
jgi:hypothetical protein